MNFIQKLKSKISALDAKKKKKIWIVSIALILIIALAITIPICCFNDDAVVVTVVDGDYTIEISGIYSEAIVVTKNQILEIGKTKEVVYTIDNPIYASDKTDDDGNLIPHSIKGVYLDDVLEEYADGKMSGAFSAMTLKAADGYETVLTQETYSTEYGGSKMILAYEYDGVTLSPDESSGSIRAVFPDQIANSWAKQLKTIEFSNANLVSPSATTLNFTEFIDSSYQGSFSETIEIDGNTYNYTYYGISISKLLESDMLNAESTDKMYITAWDHIINEDNDFYREYLNWKSYEYYESAILVDTYTINDGQLKDNFQQPEFDASNIQSGMSVKNVLSLSVKDTALVNLEMAFTRYDDDSDNFIEFSNILSLVNMQDTTKQYNVTNQNDVVTVLDGEIINSATLEKVEDTYILHYGEDTIQIKSININN
jgi:hypothetical protein